MIRRERLTMPYKWWQWRKRRDRLRFLERLALVEIHVSLAGETIVSATFESAYYLCKYGSDTARMQLLQLGNEQFGFAKFELALPDRRSIHGTA